MKRRIIFFSVFIVFGILLAILIVSVFSKAKGNDIEWVNFVKPDGFLKMPYKGIDYYFNALYIIKNTGIVESNDIEFDLSKEKIDSFVNLIIEGAKAKRLGIVLRREDIVGIEAYLPNGNRLEAKDIKELQKGISSFALRMLSKNEDNNFQKAYLLGKANVALGTQFKKYDVDYLQMYGIACIQEGLNILYKYAEVTDNKELMKSIDNLKELNKKDFQRAKEMPPTL